MMAESCFIGPILPPNYKSDTPEETNLEVPTDDENDSPSCESGQFIGPVLPNTKLNSATIDSNVYGPALPPGFKKQLVEDPVNGDSSDDECIIGPLPSEAATFSDNLDIVSDIERRSKNMKDHLEHKSNDQTTTATCREEWMLKLPENMGHKIGLVPRTSFSKKIYTTGKEEDRSGWTDTPLDEKKRSKSKEKSRKRSTPDLTESANQARNEEVAKQLEDYNQSKRPKSLLEIHQENRRKKKANEKSKPEERRPFDRDTDLLINRMDASQTKSVIDKAKLLNSRFSHGSSHFL